MLISCDFFPKPSTILIETWNIVNRIENRIKYLKCCSEKRYSVTAYFILHVKVTPVLEKKKLLSV